MLGANIYCREIIQGKGIKVIIRICVAILNCIVRNIKLHSH